ncbi:MAG TPA: hypothetical protein VGO73_00555 [Pyrinomonadaceae bacterium]|jgi:hypothetical protein|nr:hypothetical protein [Pyrinomonadaceae bacterium]
MSVISKLATALNRRDEVPNQELAKDIVRTKDRGEVRELVENLTNKDKNIPSDCIKVLYEIGAREPDLIAPYYREFARLLESKNNRLVWGAMIALDSITAKVPKHIHSLLPKLLAVADSGSVITRDHVVGILVKLGAMKQYANECVPLLIEQLMSCHNNQFPMYAEMALAVVTDKNRQAFEKVIIRRLEGLEKESQQKRTAKVLKRLTTKLG